MKIRHILLLAVVAALLAWPMLFYGPMPQGHDSREHLNWCQNFSQQFWAGEWYPRWFPAMNHGLGSPDFFVYGPLPCYVCTLLKPLATIFHFSAFNAAAYLALLGSGVCAFLWLAPMLEPSVALLTAILYMMMPYHLWADFYRRCALAECWAFVWMPLALYFTSGVLERKRYAVLGLAASYALLLVSHLFTVLIFSPVPIAFVLLFSLPGQKVRSASLLLFSMLVGGGLASVYLVPAFAHQRYISAARLVAPGYYNWAHSFLSPRALAHFSFASAADFLRPVTWTAVDLFLLVAACGVVVLKDVNSRAKKETLFWLTACVVSMFFMIRLSEPLWHLLRPLQLIQFAWRFNTVLCVAALPIIGNFLVRLWRNPRRLPALTLAAVVVLFSLWPLTALDIRKGYKTESPFPPGTYIVIDYDGLFPAWSPPNVDVASALRASQQPRVRFIDGVGTALAQVWKPRQIRFETNSPAGGWVMVNQFYYPAWKAEAPGQVSPLQLMPSNPEGLLQLKVPPGVQQVQLEIPFGVDERVGWWMSVATLLLCLLWVLAIAVGFFPRTAANKSASISA